MAHHYISAFADEKRRLTKMGGQVLPLPCTRIS